jgi:hypothetical protein
MLKVRRLALVIAAVAVLAVALSACALVKPGSFSASQPGGIGPVRLHLTLCSIDPEGTGSCGAEGEEAPPFESQSMLAVAVPPGVTAPNSFTATSGSGGPPISFTRNEEVAGAFAGLPPEEGKPSWPPVGSEVVGYLSAPFSNPFDHTVEWTLDADFGLPSPADGSPYSGPFVAGLASGFRLVGEGAPASRKIHCLSGELSEAEEEEIEEAIEEGELPFELCEIDEQVTLGVSDVKITPPAPVSAYVGGKASLPFTLTFGSSASALPGFTLGASTNLPGSAATLVESLFVPTAPHTSAVRAVTVPVSAKAKPGAYTVTLAARATAGPSAIQTATLVVAKPKLKLGKLKLNRKKGTAILAVTVSDAGKVTVSGKKVVGKTKKAGKAKTLKLLIKAKGKAKKLLGRKGKAKVKAKVSFKPTSGAVVSKARKLALKKK